MALSQNGWPAFADYGVPGLKRLTVIDRDVRAGDVWVVLNWLTVQFDTLVEKLDPAQSWGLSIRMIRGSETVVSNHASGTAVDFNASEHPLGATGTFAASQVAQIQGILAQSVIDGIPVLRWGGNYSGRKDEMHFEVNLMSNGCTATHVAKLAQRILTPAARPLPTLRPGTPGGPEGLALKRWLKPRFSYATNVGTDDDWVGSKGSDSWAAMQRFARNVGLLGRRGDGSWQELDAWGPKCWAAAVAIGFKP